MGYNVSKKIIIMDNTTWIYVTFIIFPHIASTEECINCIVYEHRKAGGWRTKVNIKYNYCETL